MTTNFKTMVGSLLLSMAIFPTSSMAKVSLPHILADNMIIQQNSDVRLWGWDKANKVIKVRVSWSKKQYTTTANKDGKWSLKVKAPAASYTPLSITFDDGEATTLRNILAGEVWVCAGQSNMEMPVKGFDLCPVQGSNETVVESAQLRGIHYVKIPSRMSMKPQDDANCEWKVVSPSTVKNCSAVGFAFAKEVNAALNIPVGLIMANKGGTRVESWLTEENLKKYTDEPLDSAAMVKKFSWDFHRPLLWGNATFNPILNYTVKGIIYYQGESNVGNPGNQYSERLKLLVEQWRKQFGNDNLPFYEVMIAPYRYDDEKGDWGAKLREQQVRAADIIPNSGIVSTLDLIEPYEIDQIHPRQKFPVGQRLAWMALNKQYGMSELGCESARFESMKVEGNKCVIKLKNLYGGVNRTNNMEGFEVAGEDKVFHKATATYDWKTGLTVTSPEVEKPIAVRYCFRNFQLGNVTNQAGLPLLPFRTDNW